MNEPVEDRGALDLTYLIEEHKKEIWEFKKQEAVWIKTQNQLDGTKQIVLEMASTIKQLKTQNDNFEAEIARLNEEIQLLEMQIKK